MDITECVGPDRQHTAITTSVTPDPMGGTDPWKLFLYALKAAATRDKIHSEVNQIRRFSRICRHK
ncbi:MAG TPA: hypothetical protein VE378_06605 [Nitrososphaeraceae archaeon]|nr:hypothetical protein [Nitrososphaeraceae archaeon]